jgi:hypothetical protein
MEMSDHPSSSVTTHLEKIDIVCYVQIFGSGVITKLEPSGPRPGPSPPVSSCHHCQCEVHIAVMIFLLLHSDSPSSSATAPFHLMGSHLHLIPFLGFLMWGGGLWKSEFLESLFCHPCGGCSFLPKVKLRFVARSCS